MNLENYKKEMGKIEQPFVILSSNGICPKCGNDCRRTGVLLSMPPECPGCHKIIYGNI